MTTAVSRIGAGTSASSIGTNNIVPTINASAAVGDLCVLYVESANDTNNINTPTGWNVAPNSPIGVGTPGAVGATRLNVFWRILDGTEGGSVTVTSSSVDHKIGITFTYRGADPTTPLTASTGQTATPATTSYTTNTIASATGDRVDIFLACCATERDSGTASTNTSMVWSNIASISSNTDANISTASNNGGGVIVISGIPSTADSTGSVSFTMSITSSIWAGILYRINAAPQAATIAANENSDTAAITTENWMTAQIAPTESSDTASITTENWITAQIAANDNSDTTSITADSGAVAPSGIDPVFFILGINKLSA